MSDSVRTTACELLLRARQATRAKGLLVETPSHIPIERPKRPQHGDHATHAALVLAKAAGKPPRAVGEAIAKDLCLRYDNAFAEIARGQHPAATTAVGGGLAQNLGLAANRRSADVCRGPSSSAGNRAALAECLCAARDEAHRNRRSGRRTVGRTVDGP
jgi:hypothetical protein